MVHRFITIWNKTNLIKRIAIGIGIGVLLLSSSPKHKPSDFWAKSSLSASRPSLRSWSSLWWQTPFLSSRKGKRAI